MNWRAFLVTTQPTDNNSVSSDGIRRSFVGKHNESATHHNPAVPEGSSVKGLTQPRSVSSVGFVGDGYSYDLESLLNYREDTSINLDIQEQPTEPTEPTSEAVLAPSGHTQLQPGDPSPPIQAGWLITYYDEFGRLRGGSLSRQEGTVVRCDWDGAGWLVCLINGAKVPLSAIRAVGKTNAAGALIAGWTVREHGYDGEGRKDDAHSAS